jgi:hypothetical protein
LTLIPFGFWAGSGGSGAVDAYFLISAVTPSSGATSVTFASIPAAYAHLEVRANALANADGALSITMNSDTSLSYDHAQVRTASSWGSEHGIGEASMDFNQSNPASGFPTNHSASIIAQVFDYRNTSKFTSLLMNVGSNVNNDYIASGGGFYNKTDVVTSLTFSFPLATLEASTEWRLYGIKA